MLAEFVCSVVRPGEFPSDGLPEIAFAGRSNVGKSSLLNALVLSGKSPGRGRINRERVDPKQLARTSRTPGRTRSVNFFRIDRAFYFVDLPGYGYARVSRREMRAWRELAESFLSGRPALRLVVLIVDARHGASALDVQMKEWLEANQFRFAVVASKADKLKSSERSRALRGIEEQFHPPVLFSAQTGEGVAPLWNRIRAALSQDA